MLDNVLVLSPHQDDECLGVGGTMFYCKKLHIHYFNYHHPNVDSLKYLSEAREVHRVLNCTTSYSDFDATNTMHLHPIAVYITQIEELVNSIKPDTIFVPAQSRNQDHRVVYESAITATRFHDTNWFVPNVLVYEQNEYMNNLFTPNYYVSIDIEKKLELFYLYKSQQRGHRKPEHIKALATLRGMEINGDYAEAFMAVRMTHG